MKLSILSAILLFLSFQIKSQTLNWSKISDTKNQILNVQVGLDYSAAIELGYSYIVNPDQYFLINANISIPLGEDIMDDYKLSLGLNKSVYQFQNLKWFASIHAIYRRNKIYYVQMDNLGIKASTTLGYFRHKGHIGLELGFDSASMTYLNHSDAYKLQYPQVNNGWYFNTARNINFGLHGSKSLGNSNDITFRIGMINGLEKGDSPLIPYYTQLGWNFYF